MAMSRIGCRSARATARVRRPGATTRRASVERYLIGVRPVLINVFIDDLVEVLVSNPVRRGCRRAASPSLPSRKPVREQRDAMLSSRRSCHCSM
ncbi:hypothetical protein CFB50_24040 [Burkholderia sp. AU33423]|nr:hypothetical protein CFB50_24040 [Burkholderia sp. AU33423]